MKWPVKFYFYFHYLLNFATVLWSRNSHFIEDKTEVPSVNNMLMEELGFLNSCSDLKPSLHPPTPPPQAPSILWSQPTIQEAGITTRYETSWQMTPITHPDCHECFIDSVLFFFLWNRNSGFSIGSRELRTEEELSCIIPLKYFIGFQACWLQGFHFKRKKCCFQLFRLVEKMEMKTMPMQKWLKCPNI